MLRLRRATPRDAEAIARIYVETWREAYAGMLPDRVLLGMSRDRQMQAWRHSVLDPAQIVIVAEEGGQILGFGSGGVSRRPSLPFAGEIYTLYVAPDHQRRGVGRAILAALLRGFSAAGRTSAIVWALADNPSRFFYEAMGAHLVAEGNEQLWGKPVRQRGYGWRDIPAWLAARAEKREP